MNDKGLRTGGYFIKKIFNSALPLMPEQAKRPTGMLRPILVKEQFSGSLFGQLLHLDAG